jgi:hypothetical protein
MYALALLVLLSPAPLSAPTPAVHPTAKASLAPISADELFSRRALRRARLLIQMRMFQFREERLECIRAALLRQLPPALRPQQPTTWSKEEDASGACLR